MITLKNISKKIDDFEILKNVNLNLPSCGLVLFRGVNGSGKTTLINIIGALDKASSGSLIINNEDISIFSNYELCKFREKYISFVFQDNNLFDNMSVKDNINIVNKSDENYDKSFKELLHLLNLEEIQDKKVKFLSGGEKQRVAIARAINKNSNILICDEPTSSIDFESKKIIFEVLKKISKSKLVLLVTHDLDFVNNYADITVGICDGIVTSNINSTQNNIENNYTFKEYVNKFNPFKFLFKNFFLNKKKIVINCVLLVISFLLCVFSISFSSIDFNKIHISSLKNDNLVIFNKNSNDESSSYIKDVEIYDEDINFFKKSLNYSDLIVGKGIHVDGYSMNFGIDYSKKSDVIYYQKMVNLLSFIDYDFDKTNFELIGKKPINSNDIVISSYLADIMMEYGVMDSEKNIFRPQNYDELISYDKEFILGYNNVNITGIYILDLNKFNSLKIKSNKVNSEIKKIKNIFDVYIDNCAGNIFVNKSFFELYSNIIPTVNDYFDFSYEEKDIYGRNTIFNSRPLIFDHSVKLTNGEYIDNLNDNEIIINQEILKLLNLNENDCINKQIDLYIYDSLSGSNDYFDKISLNIIGVSFDNDYYINRNALSKVLDKTVYYNKAFSYLNNKDFQSVITTFPLENNRYTISTNYSYFIIGLTGLSKILSKIFIIISIIICIITIIHIINYLVNSIELHKKDIAILKSLGITDKIITLLFVMELSFLSVFSLLVSYFIYYIITIFINLILSKIIYLNIIFIYINYLILILIILFLLLFFVFLFYFIYKKICKSLPNYLLRN